MTAPPFTLTSHSYKQSSLGFTSPAFSVPFLFSLLLSQALTAVPKLCPCQGNSSLSAWRGMGINHRKRQVLIPSIGTQPQGCHLGTLLTAGILGYSRLNSGIKRTCLLSCSRLRFSVVHSCSIFCYHAIIYTLRHHARMPHRRAVPSCSLTLATLPFL